MPRVLTEIAQELRHTYTLGYAPANTARGSGVHQVKVDVRAPGRHLVVRARTGYMMSPSHAR